MMVKIEKAPKKNIGQILWRSLERWVDHLFPLIWVSIVLHGILIAVYFFAEQTLPTPEEITASQDQSSFLLLLARNAFPALILILTTAMLDVIIWSYFNGKSLYTMLIDHQKEMLNRFLRLLGIDLLVITSMLLVIVLFFLIPVLYHQTLSSVFILLFLVVGSICAIFLLIFVFPWYRFILRPLYSLNSLDIKQACVESYRLFLKHGLQTIGLTLLSYLIVFLLTPRSQLSWINQLSLIILGPYVAIIIWTFYSEIILPGWKKESQES